MENTSLPTVKLRAVETSDIDLLYLLETELYEGGNSFTDAPPSRQMLWEYIQNYRADLYAERQIRLIVCDGDAAVGLVDISDYEPHDRRGFAGIAILPSMRGRGYGGAALEALCAYAFGRMGMHSLAAQIAVDNEASERTFRKAGFKSCGKLRSWLRRGKHYTDALLLQRLAE